MLSDRFMYLFVEPFFVVELSLQSSELPGLGGPDSRFPGLLFPSSFFVVQSPAMALPVQLNMLVLGHISQVIYDLVTSKDNLALVITRIKSHKQEI